MSRNGPPSDDDREQLVVMPSPGPWVPTRASPGQLIVRGSAWSIAALANGLCFGTTGTYIYLFTGALSAVLAGCNLADYLKQRRPAEPGNRPPPPQGSQGKMSGDSDPSSPYEFVKQPGRSSYYGATEGPPKPPPPPPPPEVPRLPPPSEWLQRTVTPGD